ncbi:MAG: SURF1 family cytochrome oxidase biogenesis protein [Rothia sp. (in: high G+C Gram-positive bacteria)]|nr:SURF1 family cytochrome oxidase biogenesis protein [Rothia sp. (in: high G+C Gram-positive bacteria)]
MFKLALTPRWIAGLLLVLALATGFMFLSKWQLNASTLGQIKADPAKDVVQPWTNVLKEHEPLTMQESDSMVQATGHYVAGSSYLVESKLHNGEHGYWVVSEFVPDGAPQVKTSLGSSPRAIAVARAWTSEQNIPAEPRGEITVSGRVVANDAPVYSNEVADGSSANRVLGGAAAAQLTNLWNTALYGAIVTADTEVPASDNLPLQSNGTLADNATIMGQTDTIVPVHANQVTDEEVNWLNIFYALEWVVFAGFALFLWWRMLKDSYENQNNPAQFFEYEGQYWRDEQSGRYYYWDPEDQQYYFFDDVS